VIPLTLLNFDGRVEQSFASLEWRTANELNVAGFEVQRSLDGREFITIGQVNAYNNNYTTQYRYIDSQFSLLAGGPVYYRLKMKDLNGSYRYSRWVMLRMQREDWNADIFPNPVKNNLFVRLTTPTGGNCNLQLYDAAGRQLLRHVFNTVPGRNTLPLRVEGLAQGIYFIRLEAGDRRQEIRFMKN
jgi:hypothetical protein